MKTHANVHTDDDTPVTQKLLRPAQGAHVPILNISDEVTIFVTRQSLARLVEAACLLVAEMDADEQAAELAATA